MAASDSVHARGLTLIEVLLAAVLLAALAGASVGIFCDAAKASQRQNKTPEIGAAARLADRILEEHSEALGKLGVGASWRPPIEASDAEIVFTREPCEGCPEGWARLRIASGDIVLTRFQKAGPRAEDLE